MGRSRMTNTPSFSWLLRNFRNKAGLSQVKLAELTYYDHSYICRLEQEKRYPTREAVERFCDSLKLSPGDRIRLLSSAGYTTRGTFVLSNPTLVDLDTMLNSPELPEDIRRRAVTSLESLRDFMELGMVVQRNMKESRNAG